MESEGFFEGTDYAKMKVAQEVRSLNHSWQYCNLTQEKVVRRARHATWTILEAVIQPKRHCFQALI